MQTKRMNKNNSKELYFKYSQILGHQGPIYALSQDSEYIYSASADKFVARWNKLSEEQDQFAIRCSHAPFSLLAIPNQSQLIIGLSDGSLHLIDTILKKELKYIKAHQSAVFALAMNPQQKQYYTADSEGQIFVWDKEWNLLIKLPLACGKIRQIVVAEDGSYFIAACADGFYRKFETTFFNEILQVYAHHDGCTALSILPNGDVLSAGKDAYIRRWSRAGEKQNAFAAHLGTIYQLLQLGDQHYISASRDKTIKIWSMLNDSICQKLDLQMAGHRHSINALLSFNGGFISAGDDKRIIIWKDSQLKSM